MSLQRQEVDMALYLIRLKQSPETFKNLIAKPEDRRTTIAPLLELAGGKLHGLWYAFGEYDVLALCEAPDNVTAASVITTVAASGAFSGGETTVLLTVEEMVEALQKAGSVDYRPPGG
jgi:uncharacterized protein with GYD domain